MTYKLFVGLHGDKTYNTFCLWKHHVNLLLQSFRSVSTRLLALIKIRAYGSKALIAVINLRDVSTNKKYYINYDLIGKIDFVLFVKWA